MFSVYILSCKILSFKITTLQLSQQHTLFLSFINVDIGLIYIDDQLNLVNDLPACYIYLPISQQISRIPCGEKY